MTTLYEYTINTIKFLREIYYFFFSFFTYKHLIHILYAYVCMLLLFLIFWWVFLLHKKKKNFFIFSAQINFTLSGFFAIQPNKCFYQAQAPAATKICTKIIHFKLFKKRYTQEKVSVYFFFCFFFLLYYLTLQFMFLRRCFFFLFNYCIMPRLN